MDSLTLQGNLITVLVWFAVMFLLEVFFWGGGIFEAILYWKRYGIRNQRSDGIQKMTAIYSAKYRKETDFDLAGSRNPLTDFYKNWHS